MVRTMKTNSVSSMLFPSQLAALVVATMLAVPAFAQQTPATDAPQATSDSTTQSQPSSATNSANTAGREGFWGRVNPFARKKWVNNRIAPLKGQLNELDEVNAKNANDIKDVDGRAQAGINKAQSAADAANQTALAAADQAQKASATAQGASGRIDQLGNTVGGLDQYKQISAVEVTFHGTEPILSAAARKQLDDLAASLTGHQGYILEVVGHAPGAGSVGIQSSARLTEAVKRYLVTEHQIPVYRMHAVALGNAPAENEQNAKPAKTRTVHIELMENSLAASR
jgi:outer membrane protein OmpA-like peptidoglycan-associated protein